MKTSITLLIFSFFSLILFSQNDVCQIDLPSTRVADFAHGEQVQFTFEYSVDEPGGVRIFPRPFTNGSLTPGYGASGSPVYNGDGTGSAFFTINSGDVTVDEIRFLITTADQSATLREFYIPVSYHFSENGVNNFQFSVDQKVASFLLEEQVNITFDYNINHSGGTRIFIRPITDGSLTPGYSASGSPVFNGTGSQTVNFRINSGINVRVDSLRVLVTNEDQSEELRIFFIPVNWYWSTVKVTNFSILQGNFAANGEQRTVEYDYETTETAGVRIFPRPYTNNGLTPGYGACGSGLNTGSGSNQCNFTINGSNQRVDHIRFQATNPDQSEILLLMLYPTDLFFGNLLIENLVTCPPSPARLLPGERVNGFYDYTNEYGESGRIFFRPATNGSLTPGYGASGSPAYTPGSGSGDDFFTINGAGGIVDQIHFLTTNENQSVDWGTFRFNVDYEFGDGMITSVAEPSLPETMNLKIGPNPAQDYTWLRAFTEESSRLQLRLLDLQGRVVGTWPSLDLPAGSYVRQELPLSSFNLASGIYLLQVQGETFQWTEKLIVH
ncbi:MAG: T9SS type A sorting domain-containing protein [Bacteroidota bacterium]